MTLPQLDNDFMAAAIAGVQKGVEYHLDSSRRKLDVKTPPVLNISRVLLLQFASGATDAINDHAKETGKPIPNNIDENREDLARHCVEQISGLTPNFLND